jgi:hypothetical protein
VLKHASDSRTNMTAQQTGQMLTCRRATRCYSRWFKSVLCIVPELAVNSGPCVEMSLQQFGALSAPRAAAFTAAVTLTCLCLIAKRNSS